MAAVADLLFRRVRLDDDASLVDVAITNGRFEAIGPDLAHAAAQEIAADGRVLLPGFVDGHLHLEKAFVHDRLPNRSGTLAEAIRVTAQLKPGFTRDDILQRARRVVRTLVVNGTTHARAHAEFDPVQGFTGLDAVLSLREECRDVLDLQVVAFPQEGIFRIPGTDRMLREAMRRGADVVGGIAYNDVDPRRHIDFVFDLAREFDKDVDLHQDFSDDADAMSIDYVARRTIELGYEGRVSVGHLTALDAAEPAQQRETIALLRAAGISVFCLPMTDLHLGGRNDARNVRRALTPVRALRDGGVNVCLATNNIRNAFTPFGNGDLLQVAALALPACHLAGAEDQRSLLPMLTANPARALRIAGYGIAVGGAADCVLFDCTRKADIVLDLADRSCVVKRGRIVARTRRDVELAY